MITLMVNFSLTSVMGVGAEVGFSGDIPRVCTTILVGLEKMHPKPNSFKILVVPHS